MSAANMPWWWSALTPIDTQPLVSTRDVALLLGGVKVDETTGDYGGIDTPVYSALRVAEIIAACASERRQREIRKRAVREA